MATRSLRIPAWAFVGAWAVALAWIVAAFPAAEPEPEPVEPTELTVAVDELIASLEGARAELAALAEYLEHDHNAMPEE